MDHLLQRYLAQQELHLGTQQNISYQSDDGVYGAVETVAQGSHAVVRVGVVVAQDVVFQSRFHLRQIVAHPSATKTI